MKTTTAKPLTEAQILEQAFNDTALNIQKISNAFAVLDRSPVKRKLLLLMLKDMTQVPYKDIEKVLNALPALKKEYLK